MKRPYRSRWLRTEILTPAVFAWLGGHYLFQNFDLTIRFLLSALMAIGTALLMGFLLGYRSNIETSFDFDSPSSNKPEAIKEFEQEVAKIIQQSTGKRAELIGGSNGTDINVYDNTGLVIGIVQCKYLRLGRTVDPEEIRHLNTLRSAQKVKTAYLVTTGHFNEEGQILAKELGIKLIDGARFKKMRNQIR